MRDFHKLLYTFRWQASCSRCGHRSRHYRWEWLAHLVGILHVVRHHYYAYMTFAAVDELTYRANRRRGRVKPEQPDWMR